MEQIIVDIDVIGRVNIDAQGFTGKSCTEATEQIEIALGGVQARKEKPEYHMPAGNTTAQAIKRSL